MWLFGTPRSGDLTLDVVVPLHSRMVHNLGVFLDSQLLNRQVATVARKAFGQFNLVLQLHSFLDWDAFRLSIMLWSPHSLTTAMRSTQSYP